MNYIKSLRSAINDMRSECNFKCIYDLTVSMCTNLDVTIPKPKKRKIAQRIDNGGSNQFFPDTNEQELRLGSFYPMLDIIMNGLDELFNQDTINIISSIDKLLNLDITNTDLNILSNHFNIVLKKFSVIPVTSCKCERSFSKLTQVKSKLRTSMVQERLSSLMLIAIEQEIAVHIDVNAVIDDFKNE
ncbi:zinc finger MYM-type protein 1-like, partial [Aphis craccivora]